MQWDAGKNGNLIDNQCLFKIKKVPAKFLCFTTFAVGVYLSKMEYMQIFFVDVFSQGNANVSKTSFTYAV